MLEPEPAVAAPVVAASPAVEPDRLPVPLDESPPPTLLEVVAASDIANATARLFRLWNADYAAEAGPVCPQAELQGLRCLSLENASLDAMRAHGVPALVELRLPALLDFGPEGIVRGTVLLPGHDPSLATILEADGKRHFDGIEFAEVATGKALLLFRPAITDPPGTLVEGARGASVVWLRTVLTELGGEAIESGDPLLFDAPLAAALRKFQAQRALVADGIVTDVTLLNLQSAIGTAGFVPDAGER
jgi:hypothetical protein